MFLCGSVSDVNDQVKFVPFTSLSSSLLPPSVDTVSFSVQWLSSFLFLWLFSPRARHTDNSSEAKKKSRLSHLFQLDLCTGAAEYCEAKSQGSEAKNLDLLFMQCSATKYVQSNTVCASVHAR